MRLEVFIMGRVQNMVWSVATPYSLVGRVVTNVSEEHIAPIFKV
jgi:hypothetical protein